MIHQDDAPKCELPSGRHFAGEWSLFRADRVQRLRV
jgi:hypothetical protein